MTEAVLQQIAADIRSIRQELIEIKEEVNDLRDLELEVRPEFLERLKRIDAGKFTSFKSMLELRKEIEND